MRKYLLIFIFILTPAILFAGRYALCGWGIDAMTEMNDAQKLVNKQRKLLDAAARLRGTAITFLNCGLLLASLITVQVTVALSELPVLVAIATAIPAAVCAIAFIVLACTSYTHARFKKATEKRWSRAALKKLEQKYPGISASNPRLVDAEGKQ